MLGYEHKREPSQYLSVESQQEKEKMYEVYSKLAVKRSEWRHWCHFCIFLLTLKMYEWRRSSAFIVET